jgi:glycosyltransferase involved in cell wall biosynthesis
MRVLILTSELDEGGAGIAAQRIAKSLVSANHEVDILSLNDVTNLRKFLARANRKFEYEVLNRIFGKSSMIKSSPWLPFSVVTKKDFKNYDLVFLHWVNRGFLGLNHVNKISKKKTVVWYLHSYWPFTSPDHQQSQNSNQIASRATRQFDKLNETLLAKAKENVVKWLIPSTHLISSLPEEIEFFVSHPPLPESFELEPIAHSGLYYTFICAGDVFHPQKGLGNLLHLWIIYFSKFQDRKLFVIGPIHEGNGKNALVDLSKRFGVEYLGSLGTDDLRVVLKYSKGNFVPSKEETFGQTILESLALGVPVIANSELLGLERFESSKIMLRTLDFQNYQKFEEMLRKVHPKLSVRMAMRKKTHEKFGLKTTGKQLSDLLNRLR